MAKKKEKPEAKAASPPPTPRLQTMYEEKIVAQLKEKLGRDNRLSLPQLDKIVVSMGVGSAVNDKKHIEEATAALVKSPARRRSAARRRRALRRSGCVKRPDVGCKVTPVEPACMSFWTA